jgi:hypothetical protein
MKSRKLLRPPDTSTWKCRGCGCTDAKPCRMGCCWAEENLCERCLLFSDNFTAQETCLLNDAVHMFMARYDGKSIFDVRDTANAILDRMRCAFPDATNRAKEIHRGDA